MKSNDVLLTFGYSTLANRVKNIQFPKFDESREFIVLVQNPEETSYVFGASKT